MKNKNQNFELLLRNTLLDLRSMSISPTLKGKISSLLKACAELRGQILLENSPEITFDLSDIICELTALSSFSESPSPLDVSDLKKRIFLSNVEGLDFSTRVLNCFDNHGIETVIDIVLHEEGFWKHRGFGPLSQKEIISFWKKYEIDENLKALVMFRCKEIQETKYSDYAEIIDNPSFKSLVFIANRYRSEDNPIQEEKLGFDLRAYLNQLRDEVSFCYRKSLFDIYVPVLKCIKSCFHLEIAKYVKAM